MKKITSLCESFISLLYELKLVGTVKSDSVDRKESYY